MKAKSIIGLVASLMFALTSCTASAAGLDLPIGSRDQLREYALGSVVLGFRDVESPSLVQLDGRPTWVEAVGNGAEDVLDKLLSKSISFSLANIDDTVRGRIWLYDVQGHLVFYGQSEYTPATIGKEGPEYNIWMQGIRPPIVGVASAEILVLDEDGKTTRTEQVRVEDGQPIIYEWMAGVTNGILALKMEDGSVYTFNLWGGHSSEPATTTESGGSWRISGHHVIPPSPASELLVNFVEVWELPTVFLEVNSTQLVKFDVLGMVTIDGRNVFERPTSFTFTQVEGGAWSGAGPIFPDSTTSIKLPAAGKYRIRFEWKHLGKPNTIYAGPVGDGKGL
jgi:hypothetical protein